MPDSRRANTLNIRVDPPVGNRELSKKKKNVERFAET
jgi:hypothetical protein